MAGPRPRLPRGGSLQGTPGTTAAAQAHEPESNRPQDRHCGNPKAELTKPSGGTSPGLLPPVLGHTDARASGETADGTTTGRS